jgi:hypothetical protein
MRKRRVDVPKMTDTIDASAIEEAEAEYLVARVTALLSLNGNPYRAGLRVEGPLQGFLVQATPSPMSNRLCGSPENAPEAFTILLDWFSDHNCDAAIPRMARSGQATTTERVGPHELQRIKGWTHVQLATAIDGLRLPSAQVEVEEVTAETIDAFAAIHAEAFHTPLTTEGINRASFAGLLAGGHAKGFLARISGKPVAVAIVYFATNGIAYLATAATRRGARDQGCHAALIRCRIAAAREHGSKFVAATAGPNSQSRRNLERFGLAASHMQVLYKLSRKS